jgi:hypothetical protein
MLDIKALRFTSFFLVFIASCTNVQQNTPLVGHPVHPLSSIIKNNSLIKIDTAIILSNKNLQPFINDIRESSMTVSYRIEVIPPFIKAFLGQLSDDHFTIANPGKNWNCCDGSWNDSLPNRELICVGNDKSLFLISYETGGVGTSGHLILIRYQDKKVTDFWTGTMPENLNDKKAIINYLTKNKDKKWGLNTNIIRI